MPEAAVQDALDPSPRQERERALRARHRAWALWALVLGAFYVAQGVELAARDRWGRAILPAFLATVLLLVGANRARRWWRLARRSERRDEVPDGSPG